MVDYQKAIISDFLAAARLDRQAWKTYQNAENIPDGEHVWRLWAEHALMFVAKEESNLIGTIIAFPCLSGKWYVHKLMVSGEWRQQGIGTRLFHLLLEAIDAVQADCFLTVDPENHKLITFYNRLGFTDNVYIKGYYRESEDRLVLTRIGSE
jgi:ribosomal protein S18 acetylase RimI-like enzyme